VATLVARAAPPGEVFAAVAEETGRLLKTDFTSLSRYDPDDEATVVASWSGITVPFPVGIRVGLGGRNVHTLVFKTGRAAHLDYYGDASGPPPI
jgi:GAF domain-containing protein